MTQALLRPDRQSGAALVESDGTMTWNAGVVASVERVSEGVYRVTFDEPVAVSGYVIEAQPIGTTAANIGSSIEIVDASTIIVRMVQEG